MWVGFVVPPVTVESAFPGDKGDHLSNHVLVPVRLIVPSSFDASEMQFSITFWCQWDAFFSNMFWC